MLYVDPAGHAIADDADAIVVKCPFCQEWYPTRLLETPLR